MKKIAIALTCIAMALASISCSKKANDPDSIDLTKYNPQEEPACWEVTCTSKGASATTYTWANEYLVAAGAKIGLTAAQKEGVSVSYSWSKVSAENEQACLDKNKD